MTESSDASRIQIKQEADPETTPTETTDTKSTDHCPDCEGRLITNEQQAEIHCQDCGRVIEADQIDHGPEWRAFDAQQEDARSRVGAPQTEQLHDRGLSTTIDWRNKDSRGKSLSSRQREKIQRLRTWNKRFQTKNSQERNLKHALGEISRMASALGLPDAIRETASVLYRRALDEDMIRGRSIEGMATAALYAGARIENAARSIDEIVAVSRVDELEVKRAYRYLVGELELRIEPTDPVSYLPRFASKLDCSNETERRARELIQAAVDQGVHSGRSPAGITGAALYAAGTLTNEEITQSDVSAVAKVSKVTIRNRYREVLDALAEVEG
ncbi:MAG: TFIIB-type zinc ribbon-containing protein [Halobacteriales archaeon]|nr:TFIIB-type zinc ribbon-containing protein [Halobacteriales archaeon]